MDIRVGGVPPVGSPGERAQKSTGFVEARVLAVRQPRRRGGQSPPGGRDRRGAQQSPDPATGRVLVMLIPDGSKLPEGLDQGVYRVFLRFVRR